MRESGQYAPQAIVAGADSVRDESDLTSDSESNSVREERSEMSPIEQRHDDYRGRALLHAGKVAAERGQCDRALNLYSRAVTKTEIDLQPMADGITPCFAALTADPSAYPELANSFGVTDAVDLD